MYTYVTSLMVESAACMSQNLLSKFYYIQYTYVYIVNQSKGRICGMHAAEFVIKINPVTIFDQ